LGALIPDQPPENIDRQQVQHALMTDFKVIPDLSLERSDVDGKIRVAGTLLQALQEPN
jgi:hypothetical protein